MQSIGTTAVLVALSVFAVGYACWVAYWFITENRHGRKGTKKKDTAPRESKRGKKEIIGPSKFVLDTSHLKPHTAIENQQEPTKENADIFVPESVPEHPRQIPPEDLDAVFGEAPEGESNDPLNIDYDPMDDWSNEDIEDDEEDESEVFPIKGASLAQGVKFENIGEAYRHVVHNNPELTERQKEDTGRILVQMEGTDILKGIISGKPEREAAAIAFADVYRQSKKRKQADGSGESPTPHGGLPPGFDLNKYAQPTKSNR